MSDVKNLAINAALKGDWEQAVKLNQNLLKENPNDIEALNRLAFAFAEKGNIKESKKTYLKVLTINRFHPIALKNIKRLSLLKAGIAATNGVNQQRSHFSNLFLEEVGKTKVVSLVHLAEAKVVSVLHPTNPVVLVPRRRGITVTMNDETYIGALPDDVASRLYTLIKGGNQYEAYIKSVDRNDVSVFIREVVRKPKFRNQPSFLGKGSTYYPFVRDEVMADEGKPDVSRLEDLDDDVAEDTSPAEEEPAAS